MIFVIFKTEPDVIIIKDNNIHTPDTQTDEIDITQYIPIKNVDNQQQNQHQTEFVIEVQEKVPKEEYSHSSTLITHVKDVADKINKFSFKESDSLKSSTIKQKENDKTESVKTDKQNYQPKSSETKGDTTIKFESGIEISSSSAHKISKIEPLFFDKQQIAEIPVGTIAMSTEEVIKTDQIERNEIESKLYGDKKLLEKRTVVERDLVESKQIIERTETQTIEPEIVEVKKETVVINIKPPIMDILATTIATQPSQSSTTITITTFASTPQTQKAILTTMVEPSTGSMPTTSESISTSSSSSFYIEPTTMTSSILRSTSDNTYSISGADDFTSTSSSSINFTSDEDNLFHHHQSFSPINTNISFVMNGSSNESTMNNNQIITSLSSPSPSSNRSENSSNNNNQPFDVDREWGRPLGLPTPQPPIMSNTGINPGAKLPPLPPQSISRLNLSYDRVSRPPSRVRETYPPENDADHNQTAANRIRPVYVELAYVPGHGKRGYCNEQFFRKVRARYYVFSGVTPSRAVFDAFLNAKASWEQNHYVTIIPTYESEALLGWIADNQQRLVELRIDVTPAANRCSINLSDNSNRNNNNDNNKVESVLEDSCAAYKVEL